MTLFKTILSRRLPVWLALLSLPALSCGTSLAKNEGATAIQAKIDSAFAQLFHGERMDEAIYFSAGTNASGALAYIKDLANADVRSEGMSYGLMIAGRLDKKTEFDALWNWAKTFMYHGATDHPALGFFSWSLNTDGVANDGLPAPDGEQYFAMALYFAENRWGHCKGIYNYRLEADALLDHLKNREPITGTTVKGSLTAGTIFSPAEKLVRFTPDTTNWNHTVPSSQLPAFYKLRSCWGSKKERMFWAEAATASHDFFSRTAHLTTGLAPDYASFDGTPRAAPWNPHSANFQYDSGRTAMNAVTSLPATDAVRAKKFVAALGQAPVPSGSCRYYDRVLYLLSLLHCSGEFKILQPQ